MENIKLTFSGDIILDNEIIELYKQDDDTYNFDSMFSEGIKEFFLNSDYVIGNLETPITIDKKDIKYKRYSFTSPIEFAQAIKNIGFDLVTTANNHCLDNGKNGIKKTLDALDKVGLENTGISYGKEKLKIKNFNDIKIAFLSYTYVTNAFVNNIYLNNNEKNISVNLFQVQELSNIWIRKLYQSSNIFIKILRKIFKLLGMFQLNKMVYERQEKFKKQRAGIIQKINECRKLGADCIIMCMHEGGQYNKLPIEKAKNTASFLTKNGIDLVIGNHEHVIQCMKFENNKLVAYSLGNFIDTAGVIKGPFDKMAEYSILCNVYLSKKNNKINYNKYTFTILKSVIDKKEKCATVKVELLYNLIKNCKNENEKQKLLRDNQKIVEIITKDVIDINNVQLEYEINNNYK